MDSLAGQTLNLGDQSPFCMSSPLNGEASWASAGAGGSPSKNLMASTDGRGRHSKLGASRSAPLLGAPAPAHTMTWYSTGSTAGTTSRSRGGSSIWRPLGDTWRETEKGSDASEYINGRVPHWGKGSLMRKAGCLEHELTWAYYRMRRRARHPQREETRTSQREEVGDPYLPDTDVVAAMRQGTENKFKFWDYLKPPFDVVDVKRVDDGQTRHPDGEFFDVTYECGIDFVSERLWGQKQVGGTFDNKIHGVAKVRIPDKYPKVRPIHILSWGRPVLNWKPEEDLERVAQVDPSHWSPIGDQLTVRANHPRLAQCRDAAHKAFKATLTRSTTLSQSQIDVPSPQRDLPSPHASLPRLADAARSAGEGRAAAGAGGGESKPKQRQHRIWTQAAGFVTYNG